MARWVCAIAVAQITARPPPTRQPPRVRSRSPQRAHMASDGNAWVPAQALLSPADDPNHECAIERVIEIEASDLTTAEPDAEKPSLLVGTNSRGQTPHFISIRSADHRSTMRSSTACPVWTGCAVYGCVIDGGTIRSSRSFTNHRRPIRSSAAGSIDAIDTGRSIRRVADSQSREQDGDCEYSAFHCGNLWLGGVPRDKQDERRASIRMRKRRWVCDAGRA